MSDEWLREKQGRRILKAVNGDRKLQKDIIQALKKGKVEKVLSRVGKDGKVTTYRLNSIDIEGQKDVIGIYVGENESSKFWLSVLNDLKNRGVKDILILCADALSGIKDAINAAFRILNIRGV